MVRSHHLGLLLGLLATCMAEPAVYSLGSYGLYSASATSTPTLSGTAYAYEAVSGSAATGIPKDGINVFLSADLQATLKETMDSKCEEINEACYESVKEVLVSPKTNMDARALPVILEMGAMLTGILAVTFPFWYKEEKLVPVNLHIPAAQMSEASAAQSATTIAVATGTASPFITISQEATATTLTGSAVAVTTLAAASNGHVKGDVIISMDKSLAATAEELIKAGSSANCASGTAFNAKLRKRGTIDYGSVICGAMEVITNMEPGAGAHDLITIHAKTIPWTSADAVRAMNTMVQMAGEYATILRVDPQTAALIGAGVFALSLLQVGLGTSLSTENVIPVSLISSSSTTACTKTTHQQCLVGCTQIGAMEACETSCAEVTACGGTSTSMSTTATVPWTVYGDDRTIATAASVTATTTSTKATTTSASKTTSASAAASSILIIWDAPPVTGPAFYDFYEVKAGFNSSLDTQCGQADPSPSPKYYVYDTKAGRVDSVRSAGKVPVRVAPGTMKFGSCTYVENTLGKGTLTCGSTITCQPPVASLAAAIEPNNGECADTNIKDVRTLVMVCVV